MRGLSNDFLKKFIRKYNFSNSEHFVKSGVGKLQNERGCAMINGCKGTIQYAAVKVFNSHTQSNKGDEICL